MNDNAAQFLIDNEFNMEGQPALTCHVELSIKVGATHQDINVATAKALREIAAQIEADKLDTGHHLVKGPNGEDFGEVYLDHYEILE